MENHTKLYIVMYHYVRDLENSRYPKIKGMDQALFKKQIAFFQNQFQFVTMEKVLEAWNGNGRLPERALLLTFDDGYIDNYVTVFPILQENHIQGSFFITGKTFSDDILLDVNKVHFILASGRVEDILKDLLERMNYYRKEDEQFPTNEELFHEYAQANRFDSKEIIFVKRMLQTVLPERIRNQISSELFQKYVGLPERIFARELYLNRDQIRCMKKNGMFLGIHGYDHYWLGRIPEAQMIADMEKSLDVMGDFIDPNYWVMNYPYGSYNENVVSYIASRGCSLGLTTDMGIADAAKDGKYLLPRLDCNDFPPKSHVYTNFK